MANVYVYSGAAGAGTGADWANAFTTLSAACTAKAAGDDFWVAHDHAETQASAMFVTSPGTAASPCRIICVNRAGSVPPVAADLRDPFSGSAATITTTGANSITLDGYAFYYGISFNSGTGAVSSSLTLFGSLSYLRLCKLSKLATTSNTSAHLWGNPNGVTPCRIILDGTTATFGNTGDRITPRNSVIVWRNTASAIGGATIPTQLFSVTSGNRVGLLTEAVDLSAITGTLVGNGASASHKFDFKDCKLGSGVAVSSPSSVGMEVNLFRCDSGATNYRTERYLYEGTQTTETTIVRTGGASDGTTTVSWALITTANSKRYLPFEALPIAIWNDSTSSVTVTVYGIWGGGAVPNNDDIWMDVEYLGASGNPQGSFVSAGPADQLVAGSALTTDTSTWGGSTTKFKMTTTFTPAQKGTIYIYIKAAAASSTFYIDPKAVLS